MRNRDKIRQLANEIDFELLRLSGKTARLAELMSEQEDINQVDMVSIKLFGLRSVIQQYMSKSDIPGESS